MMKLCLPACLPRLAVLALTLTVVPLDDTAVAAEGLSPGTVLFRAGDDVIVTGDDLRAEMLGMPVGIRREVLSSGSRIGQLFDRMALRIRMAREAERLGLDTDPIVAARLRAVRDQELQRLLLERQAEGDLPDFEVLARERYQVDKAQFMAPEEVDASHILIAMKNRSEADALARAEEVLTRLRAGESFADLAGEFSDDPSAAKNHGHLGFFPREQMVKPFADAAFAMTEPGQLSKPVKTTFGYHVIRFEGRRPARQLDFTEARPGIVAEARDSYIKQRRQTVVSDYRQSLGPSEVDEAALEAFIASEMERFNRDTPPAAGAGR